MKKTFKQVRVSLGNVQETDKPFEYIVQDSIASGKYSVCNNQEHRLMVDVTNEGLVTQFDSKPAVAVKYPKDFTISILNRSLLYLAGLKSKNKVSKLNFLCLFMSSHQIQIGKFLYKLIRRVSKVVLATF